MFHIHFCIFLNVFTYVFTFDIRFYVTKECDIKGLYHMNVKCDKTQTGGGLT